MGIWVLAHNWAKNGNYCTAGTSGRSGFGTPVKELKESRNVMPSHKLTLAEAKNFKKYQNLKIQCIFNTMRT